MPVSSFFCSEITGKVVTAQKKVKIGNRKARKRLFARKQI